MYNLLTIISHDDPVSIEAIFITIVPLHTLLWRLGHLSSCFILLFYLYHKEHFYYEVISNTPLLWFLKDFKISMLFNVQRTFWTLGKHFCTFWTLQKLLPLSFAETLCHIHQKKRCLHECGNAKPNSQKISFKVFKFFFLDFNKFISWDHPMDATLG